MTPELGTSLLGIFFTLAIFSYLFGDNPLLRFTLNIFVGVTAGYLAFVVYQMVLAPWASERLVLGNWSDRLLAIVPLVMGVILLVKSMGIFAPRLSRFSRLALAFLIGVGGAVAIGGALTGTLMPQVWGLIQVFERDTLLGEWGRGLLPLAGYLVNGSMLLLGALTTLLAFHYGKDVGQGQVPMPNRLLPWITTIGKFFVAAALGVIFAGIYQTGLTALVERLDLFVNFLQGQVWPR
jgi:hypothetical protein